jgi:CubicO group peptidase (beta-lactamase class C family)
MNAQANDAIQVYLEELVADGEQLGLQVAAYLDGELVVDTWAGVAERATGRPVDGDTLFTVWSVGKGIVATCVHLLAERGALDYDAPIARYWPAFGASGKARATVRDALTHRAGVPQLPPGTAITDCADWERMCAGIAAQAPLWEPGTQTGYHAVTFGWIVGEIIRRIDGRAFSRFVQEEICAPLGMRDCYFGIPDEVEQRTAVIELSQEQREALRHAPDSLPERAFPYDWRDQFNRPELRRASIPGGGAIASARDRASLRGPDRRRRRRCTAAPGRARPHRYRAADGRPRPGSQFHAAQGARILVGWGTEFGDGNARERVWSPRLQRRAGICRPGIGSGSGHHQDDHRRLAHATSGATRARRIGRTVLTRATRPSAQCRVQSATRGPLRMPPWRWFGEVRGVSAAE